MFRPTGSAAYRATISPYSLTHCYFQFTTTGGLGGQTWSLEPGNTLPAGFSLTAAGVLSGSTPTASSYFFNVRVRDASGQTALKGFSLQVQ